ncbi:MAG: hypothetical protein QOJ99_4331 [Bryobacterales bacterium]|nr:hypothetical protein [Bryobacterales bacterium]
MFLPEWADSSVGRAPRSQCGGRGFEPLSVHQSSFSSFVCTLAYGCCAFVVSRRPVAFRICFSCLDWVRYLTLDSRLVIGKRGPSRRITHTAGSKGGSSAGHFLPSKPKRQQVSASKVRILFISYAGAESRAERALLCLTERIRALEISLLSPAGDLQKQILPWGVECRLLNESGAPSGRAIAQIRNRVREWKPDIIHALNTRSGVLALLATVGMSVRVVWQAQDVCSESPLTAVIRVLLAASARAHVVRVDGYLKRKSDRVHVLDKAIDPILFHPATRTDRRVDASSLRNEFGFSTGAFVVAMVGRITASQGQLEIIRAFPAILARIPRAVLLIAGTPLSKSDWEYRARMDQAIKHLELTGRICLTGEQQNMAPFYRGIDALIVNSAAEPFGLSILEAMACGRPVVAADVGSARKFIQSRLNGLLYETGNYSELAEHLVGLAASLPGRDEMGARARESVTCRFTIDIQRTQLLAIYKRVLDTKHHLLRTTRFNSKQSDATERARL